MMTCSRCGAEAAIRRDAAYYCGKCAVARDWGEVIAIVQDGRGTDRVVFDHTPGSTTTETENAVVGGAATGDPFTS